MIIPSRVDFKLRPARDMNMLTRTKILFLLFTAVLLAGCAPVISESTLATVDREVGFEELVKNPGAYTGRRVLLGGTIIKVENLEDRTMLEVLQAPIKTRLRPGPADESAGRFLVEFDGFLDPVVYSGKLMTVAGTVEGVLEKTLGKMTYKYPVIRPVEHYIWRKGYDTGPRFGIGVGVGIIHTD